jgi:integrase
MKNTTNIPKMCFHKARGLHYVTLSGSRYYLGADPKEAERRYRLEVAQWLGRGCQPPPPPAEDLTLVELCSRYLAFCSEYYAQAPAASLERHKGAIAKLLKITGEDMLARDVTPGILKVLRNVEIEVGNTRMYINRNTDIIVRMYRWAVSESLAEPDVYARLKALEHLKLGFTTAKEGSRRQPITDDELDTIEPYLSSVVMSALRVLYLSGARPSEILNLKVQDIDRSGDVWRVDLARHKTRLKGKTRTLFFGPRSQRILAPLLLRPAGQYVFDPRESLQERLEQDHANRKTPLHYGNSPGTNRVKNPQRPPGDHYDYGTFARAVKRGLDRCNRDRKAEGKEPMRNICVYETRHGAATNIREAASLDAVQAVMGHAKVDMSQHYAVLSEGLAEEIMRRMG